MSRSEPIPSSATLMDNMTEAQQTKLMRWRNSVREWVSFHICLTPEQMAGIFCSYKGRGAAEFLTEMASCISEYHELGKAFKVAIAVVIAGTELGHAASPQVAAIQYVKTAGASAELLEILVANSSHLRDSCFQMLLQTKAAENGVQFVSSNPRCNELVDLVADCMRELHKERSQWLHISAAAAANSSSASETGCDPTEQSGAERLNRSLSKDHANYTPRRIRNYAGQDLARSSSSTETPTPTPTPTPKPKPKRAKKRVDRPRGAAPQPSDTQRRRKQRRRAKTVK